VIKSRQNNRLVRFPSIADEPVTSPGKERINPNEGITSRIFIALATGLY
jgi:hypothetical protein